MLQENYEAIVRIDGIIDQLEQKLSEARAEKQAHVNKLREELSEMGKWLDRHNNTQRIDRRAATQAEMMTAFAGKPNGNQDDARMKAADARGNLKSAS